MTLQKHAGAVRRFGQMIKAAAWLQTLPARLTPPPVRLMQIGSAFWQSRALYVAAQLDIASVLGDERLAVAEIARRVDANADSLGRLLRLLVAIGVFEAPAAQVFANNTLSACLRRDMPGNVRAMILLHNSAVMSRPWFEQLERGVREGQPPFELCHGKDLFEYLDQDPAFDQAFSQAMDCVEALAGDSFATDFDWGRFTRVIDVGGSRGSKSLAILKRYPQLSALVVDRAQVIAEAEQFWAAHPEEGVARLKFAVGDVCVAAPPACGANDIYLLSALLHGFDDTGCVTALRHLARASGHSGAPIALLEMVLPERDADLAGASFDMQMLMGTRGRERTLREWEQLFARSGVHLVEVVNLRSFAKILLLQVTCPAPAPQK